MTTKRLAVLCALAVLLSAPFVLGGIWLTLSITMNAKVPSVQSLRHYSLIFDDEFDGTVLDGTKWSTCYDWYVPLANGCTNDGNNELEWYVKDAVAVSDGSLVLTARQSSVLGVDVTGAPKVYPYRSGMVSTGSGGSGSVRWKHAYGYYEARIMNPSGQGIWPAFWMLPTGRNWPPEIDIMEQTGDKPHDLLMTYFWPDPVTVSQKDTATHTAPTSLAGQWHTYGILWEKDRLVWYLDGKAIRTVRSSNVPSQPLELMLNLAVGGILPGPPDETTAFPARMKVDYVRVYAAK